MIMKRLAALVVAVVSPACHSQDNDSGPPQHISITHADMRPATTGSSDHFTGTVVITPMFDATKRTRASGASGAFQPGARTAWHSHPAGQWLIVTSGTGWVEEWGGAKQEIKAGDVVWTPPGIKHWHGATEVSPMTHFAVQEQVGGDTVDWKEPVSDQQYRN
jgi:quercetin dioxygenase-like cupin family protein